MRQRRRLDITGKFRLFPLVLFLIVLTCASGADAAITEEDPMFGIKEGWAWPVVVVQPPEGWESPVGESIKYAMRAAEREISLQRDGIRGREVTFMFSSVNDPRELPERLRTWRGMKVAAIVSFADAPINEELHRLCREQGPSVLYAGGEEIAIKNADSGTPYPYLFALDLPYFARANALTEVALQERPLQKVAVITDILSEKLAKGAALNVEFLRARGIDTTDLSVAAFRQDQFNPQVRNAEADGVRVFTCWLDAMATLSIWRTASMKPNGSVIYYAGNQQKILLDAQGLVIVDKDVLLERNEGGKYGMILKIRDFFNREITEPVTAAKAYALGHWVIGAYRNTADTNTASLASALASVENIPLMDETLSIDPGTNRPKSRKFGVLMVLERVYESRGSVEVFSSEVIE